MLQPIAFVHGAIPRFTEFEYSTLHSFSVYSDDQRDKWVCRFTLLLPIERVTTAVAVAVATAMPAPAVAAVILARYLALNPREPSTEVFARLSSLAARLITKIGRMARIDISSAVPVWPAM